jgi:hypothetical protein
MVDGRIKNGGARPGAGRKPKTDEEKVKNQAIAAIESLYGSVEAGLQTLLNSGESSLIKFVFEHAVGKPRDKVDMDIEDHTVVLNETKTYLNGSLHKANTSN